MVAGLQAFLGALQGLERGQDIDLPAILAPVPTRDLSCYRVTVNRPRPGRDGGKWVLRIRAPGRGEERREPTELDACPETRVEAEELARLKEVELNTGGKPTFLELFDLYQDYQRDVAKVAQGTLTSYTASRRHLIGCGLASLTEDELTHHEINKAKSKLCKKLKNTTAKTKAVHWSGCWRWAYQEGLVGVPWPETKKIRVTKADTCKKKAYTDQEVADVLEHFKSAGHPKGRYFSFVWALAETGARADAMAHVRGCDLELDPESGGTWIRLSATKTGPERRVLVSPELADLLPQVEPGAYVWSSRRGGRPGPLNYPNVTGLLRSWLKERGLFGLRDLHSLRRSAAHKLHTAKTPTEEARRVTGQSAEVFLRYAGRGHYTPREACRKLWLAPQGTQERETGPTVEDRRGQLLHFERSEQHDPSEDTLNGLTEPSSPNTAQAETEVLAALRFVIGDGSGWPQALSILRRCVVRLRSELPPT